MPGCDCAGGGVSAIVLSRQAFERGRLAAVGDVFGMEDPVRAVLKYGWRVLVAIVALSALSWASLRLQATGDALGSLPADSGSLFLLSVLREALTVGALLWPTLRSRWSGTQLTCALFVVYFLLCLWGIGLEDTEYVVNHLAELPANVVGSPSMAKPTSHTPMSASYA